MRILSLDGNWQARCSDYQRGRPEFAEQQVVDAARFFDVRVPGEIHADLMRLGVLADVYRGTNVLAARWVEEQIWSYRQEFDAPAEACEGRAWLVFECLDLAARVVLNGKLVAEHANAFLPLRVEVSGALRAGANLLTVHLDPGLFGVADKPAEGWYHANSKDQLLHKRHWLRKPQCQFGWDWSPRMVNVGIQGSVRLEYTASPLRIDRFVPLATLANDLQSGRVRGRLFVENLTAEPIDGATLALSIDDTSARVESPVTLKPGLHAVEATIEIDHPALWWPIGQGKQARYAVRASLAVGGKTYDVPPKHVGFRHVRVNQDPHPQGGQFFHFVINGRPVFCKGANLVPADLITASIDRHRYVTLVDRSIECNFNMLRVWGGGIYESDDFFDLCDHKGILVWQEFIFACGRYPITDERFQQNVIAEATHQIRRLAHHPSLITWCGNNENETMHWHWGPGREGVIAPDYSLYHSTLPRLLRAEHPDIYYQPSSPFSPDPATSPSDYLSGDQHPWAIGFNDTDFRKYRNMPCRFPDEGGILGPTSLATILDCLLEGQQFIHSFAWQQHDNSVAWADPSPIDVMTQFWLGMDCRKMSIEQYVYWAGLIQGEGLRAYIDNFRRRMFDSGAAVFWMYNDTWPATRSWTVVDYALRRTPSFHPVRRAFAPVSVVLVEEKDDVIVFGINDTPEPRAGPLRFGLFTTAGHYVLDLTEQVILPPNASTAVARFSRGLWNDPSKQVAFAVFGDGPAVRNRLILPLLKDLQFVQQPQVNVSVSNGRATFRCDAFVLGVCLDLNGADGGPADNFFDLYPNQPYTIDWPHPQPPVVRFIGNLPSET